MNRPIGLRQCGRNAESHATAPRKGAGDLIRVHAFKDKLKDCACRRIRPGLEKLLHLREPRRPPQRASHLPDANASIEDFWALRDISFEIKRGETFCIVGQNGSGKSTLLQMVAGILRPSAGTVTVNGRVSALLELGAGFNQEFSGRDNVYLNGAILGLSTKQIDQRYRDIEDFAEIGEFIHQPVKTYSSGMVVRLAFAVAINVDPEVLLVDEALAVGDLYFRHRCMRKVHELRTRGVTILFVSHAAGDVKAIGDRTMWLENGRMVEIGETDKVVERYLAAMVEKGHEAYLSLKAAQPRPEWADATRGTRSRSLKPFPISTIATATGRAEVIGIAVVDPHGRASRTPSAQQQNNRPHQRARQRKSSHAHRRLHDAQPFGDRFRRHQHQPRRI